MTFANIEDTLTKLEKQIDAVSDADKEHVSLRLNRLISDANLRFMNSTYRSGEDLLFDDYDLLHDNVPV